MHDMHSDKTLTLAPFHAVYVRVHQSQIVNKQV